MYVCISSCLLCLGGAGFSLDISFGRQDHVHLGQRLWLSRKLCGNYIGQRLYNYISPFLLFSPSLSLSLSVFVHVIQWLPTSFLFIRVPVGWSACRNCGPARDKSWLRPTVEESTWLWKLTMGTFSVQENFPAIPRETDSWTTHDVATMTPTCRCIRCSACRAVSCLWSHLPPPNNNRNASIFKKSWTAIVTFAEMWGLTRAGCC